MKLSDFVVQFLVANGVKNVYAVTGGACVHLLDSVAKSSSVSLTFMHHEQSAAMAADAETRADLNSCKQ